MDRSTTLDALDLESSRFLLAVSNGAASLAAPVPSCPGWDVSQLVNHLGRIYARTALIVSDRRLERPDPAELPVAPDGERRVGWFAEHRTSLLGVLESADDDAPVWNFAADRPAPTGFWARRMVHETLIHRVDAEVARGLVPAQGDADLAADTLEELFEVFLPRFETELLETGPSRSVHFHATDVPGAEWTVRLQPGEVVVTHEHAKADAAVRGGAFDLACWAYGRLPAERLEISGDARVASRFQEAARI